VQKQGNPFHDSQADILYKDIFSRNAGLISEAEQSLLRRYTVAIAGVGGVGGLLAERLIRIGVGHLKITDPGNFEKSNFNRQFGSSMITLDHNKAEAVYEQLKDINPTAQIIWDKIGISDESSANVFIHDADLIIDEMDFGMFKQSIRLQRAARQQNKYYFFTSAIGYGALIAIFDPKGLTLEEFDDFPVNVNLDGGEKLKVSIERIVPNILTYNSVSLREVLTDIYAGKRTIPTSSVGVGLASSLAANEAVNIILKKREIPVVPRYIHADLMDYRMTVGNIKTETSKNKTHSGDIYQI
jgi:Dinucleotide-utilizing enzymes involved in molybdopterin and thiamine biosynthesis family 1